MFTHLEGECSIQRWLLLVIFKLLKSIIIIIFFYFEGANHEFLFVIASERNFGDEVNISNWIEFVAAGDLQFRLTILISGFKLVFKMIFFFSIRNRIYIESAIFLYFFADKTKVKFFIYRFNAPSDCTYNKKINNFFV